jgi:hypothetical protein
VSKGKREGIDAKIEVTPKGEMGNRGWKCIYSFIKAISKPEMDNFCWQVGHVPIKIQSKREVGEKERKVSHRKTEIIPKGKLEERIGQRIDGMQKGSTKTSRFGGKLLTGWLK